MTFGDPSRPLRQAVAQYITEGAGNFNQLILDVHAWQRNECEVYANFCQSFPRPERWQEIPALPLEAFRLAEIRAFPAEETARTFHTSGTTGEGHGRHHFRSLALYEAAARGGWAAADLPNFPVFSLVPSPAEAPHSSLSCMAGWLTDARRFFWQRPEELVRQLEEFHEPCILLGTALAFLDFFERLGRRSLPLPKGSAAVETGGYKGTRRSLPKEELYALFAAKLDLPAKNIWNEYGMTELSSQFYARGLGSPHRGGPWIRGMVVDPVSNLEVAVGETGVLYLFDLANIDSCCALQTRDLAIRETEGFTLIGRDPAALPRGCSRSADDLLTS